MTSRDGSNRTGGRRPSPQPGRETNPSRQSQGSTRTNWDVDPAEIDRYLSGRPSREQEDQAKSRSQRPPAQGTANQLDQLQRARGGRQTRPQGSTRPASAGRQQFADPVYPEEFDEGVDESESYVDPDTQHDDEFYEPASTRQARRQQPARRQSPPARQQRPAPRQPVYEDDEYDDELYADDPYLTYDGEDDWEAPAPRRQARQRPPVKLTKPSLPKFTMPQAISQAELTNDIPALAMIGGAILSAAVMAILVSNRMDGLPITIPTHVSASGVAQNVMGRNSIWSIPLLSIILSLMNIAAAWFFARIDLFAARFMLGASLLVQVIAWVAVLRYLWP